MLKAGLFVSLGVVAALFLIEWIRAAKRNPEHREKPRPLDYAIGLGADFLDTLGIGSFATISSSFKLTGLVRDELIPGTMNVGAVVPAILEAYIYMAVIDVDPTTLALMILASVVGAWFGAGVVARWPRRKIQVGMGLALLTTAGFGLATQLKWLPGGGDLLGLTGMKLIIAMTTCGVLGALMTLGIGFFAPCMMVVYLMGMNAKAAFPIMMGATAFLGAVASVRFIRKGSYSFGSALGLTIGGIPGVLLAAYLVRSLPLGAVRWLVIVVVTYTALMMLRSAAVERAQAKKPVPRTAGLP